MAQAGYTPIRLYYSTTASAVPDAANLAAGELALNIADMKLYCENSSGVVTLLASSGGASGDVVGPASATDNAVVRFDGTTGKLVQNSGVLIADDGTTVISVNSATDALRITQTGAGNALVVEDSTNPDSTPFVVDANGLCIQGSTSSVTTPNYGGTASIFSLQTLGTATSGTGYVGHLFGTFNNSTGGPGIFAVKSRSGTIGGQTVVNSGDKLFAVTAAGSDGTGFIRAADISYEVDGTPGTNDMPGRLVFSTTADGASSPTERMRIDNAGQIGIGGTPAAGETVRIVKAMTGSTSSYGIAQWPTVNSDVTTAAYVYRSIAYTQAASFTLTGLHHFNATQGGIGATSAVTNQFGFVADSTLTGATNNYGFYSNIASGTGRWNFYANGTADNYFGGAVGIGGTALTGETLRVAKNITGATTSYAISNVGTVLSDVTTTAVYNYCVPATQATSFTVADVRAFQASNFTPGAGSTVTNYTGFFAGALTAGTNNYGFYGNIASGSNRWNLYMNGTAENYMAGNLKIGATTARGTTAGTNHLSLFNGTAPAGTLTNGVTLYSASGDFNFMDSSGNGFKVGFRNIPAVGTKTGSYTLATGDVGKYVQLGASGAITIPDATFAEGDVISIFNNTATTATITCSITTAYIAGTDSDKATMTLASRGVATILFISSTVCVVSGNVT